PQRSRARAPTAHLRSGQEGDRARRAGGARVSGGEPVSPRRALWSDPAATNGATPEPPAPTTLPARNAPPLPTRSAVDASATLARLATLLTEAAGIIHELAQVQLAVRAQEALMCSVKEPAAPARLLSVRDVAQRLSLSERTVRRL